LSEWIDFSILVEELPGGVPPEAKYMRSVFVAEVGALSAGVPKQPFGGAYCGSKIFMKYVSGSVFEQPIISTRDEMDKTLGPETFALTP
jgi:hypothetical protein